MDIITKTKNKLNQSLPEATINIIDNSINHVGHGSSGAHLELEIIYHGFEGKTLIQQHQLIYEILKEEMKEEIHALKIITKVK